MDTIETTEPVGSDGATSSPDTSADDTQTAETTDSVSDGEVAEAGEAPKLFAGKYESPEELEKAYLEAQKMVGQVSQKAEIANLLEKQTGMTADQIKDFITRQESERLEQAIQENPGLAAFQEVQTLKQQLALKNEEAELDKFLSSEAGKPYQNFRDKIFDLGVNLFNGRVKEVKSYDDIAREYFGQARAQGQQDAYKKIDNKVMTQATGASQAAPKSRLTLEDMDNMSVEELEAILPHADTSKRLY